MSDFCPQCGCDSYRTERTSLPEHLLEEYCDLLRISEEAAEEFENANTEEFSYCYHCGSNSRD